MIKHTVKTIHKLRVWFLVLITLGFLYVAGLNPVDISLFLGAKLGRAVGMTVGVPENPFNKLAAQLKEKENLLSEKEQELQAREYAVAQSTIKEQQTLIIFLAIGIGVLFFLVIINYYLDFRRRKFDSSIKIKS